ncbi:MAG TPA: IMP cyclohydrolase [Thermodesulfobacteriaceae bacterium]|nr:IMP cyclohydrolase [Thermodesulfobacteriaceae bacterium]
MSKINRALISVTDKTGIADLAGALKAFGVEIISTGGTARVIREAGIDVKDVSELTGFPEMMDGRVKTLHPRVHGGILALRDNPAHAKQMEENGILPVDLVAVNLYAFEKTVAREGVTLADAIENIDIGGPTLLRSSAKNFRYVTVVVEPSDYSTILKEMEENNGATTLKTRFELARKVFATTSRYDQAITSYLQGIDPDTDEYFAQS